MVIADFSQNEFENYEGSSTGSANLSVTISGHPSQKEYDVYDSTATYPASMFFHRKGMNKVTISNGSASSNAVITKIEFTVGGKTFAEIKNFDMNSSGNLTLGTSRDSSTYPLYIEFDLDQEAYDFDLYRPKGQFYTSHGIPLTIKSYGDKTYADSTAEMIAYERVTFDSVGFYDLTVKITYFMASDFTNVKEFSKNITLIEARNPILSEVWVVEGNIIKTEFELNEPFTYDDVVVKAKYNYAVSGFHSKTQQINSYSITKPDMSTEGTKDVTISYGGFEDTYQITVGATLTKTLEVNFGSIPSSYYIDDVLNISTVTGVFTIDTKIASDNDIYPITTRLDHTNFTFGLDTTPFERSITLSETGTFTLVVYYQYEGKTYSSSKEITVIDAEVTGFELGSLPTKNLNSYIKNQKFDLSGLTFKINYNVESKKEANVTYLDDRITLLLNGYEISKVKALDLSDDGKLLTAKLKNTSYEVEVGNISVSEIQLESISIKTNPNVTSYTCGDKFSLAGIAVRAKFNNGNETEIYADSLTSSYDNYTFTKDDFSENNSKSIVEVSYTYNNITKTAPLEITFVYPTFKSLDLNTEKANKNFEDLDVFVEGDIKVYAVFENGYKEEITSYTSDAEYVLNLDESNKIDCTNKEGKKEYGIKTITISALNPYDSGQTISATYEVTVETSGQIKQAYLTYENSDLTYYVGEKFDAHGIKFVIQDIDGNVVETNNFTTAPALGTTFRSAKVYEIEFTYTKGDFTKTEKLNIKAVIKNKQNLSDDFEYAIAIGDINGVLFEKIAFEEAEILLGEQEDGSFIYPIFDINRITIDTDTTHQDTYGYNVYTGETANEHCIGYMDLGLQDKFGNIIRNAHVIFFNDVSNPIEGDGNIVVTFPHYIEGYSDRINKCRFGKVYNNRLFLSGNPNYKNCDWHSEEINVAQTTNYENEAIKDFTYFSDLDYCRYGSDETAVVGYDIYRDGDLVVFKETSRNEATLYKRSSSLINAVDYAGNVLNENLIEDAYPCFDINSNGGEGTFTSRTIVNFVGDTLFLTRNGLKVLTSKETTSNNSRYSSDVSSYINKKITKEELENAHLFTFKERLFLKTSRGVYVAEYTLRNANNEYEWYFLDLDASIFFEIDNELYFADYLGNINKFVYDSTSYVDKKRVFVNKGGALLENETNDTDGDGFSIDEGLNSILVSKDYANEIVNGRDFHLITTYTDEATQIDKNCLIHASLGKFVHKNYRENEMHKPSYNHNDYIGIIDPDTNSLIIELDDFTDMYYDGRKIYVDELVGYPLPVTVDIPYTLSKVNKDDPLDHSYHLLDDRGNIIELNAITSMRVSIIVNELHNAKITEAKDSVGGGKIFQLIGDHNRILDLIYYNGRNDRYSGVITSETPVKAFYETKPYNFGVPMYEKIVHSWILVNDSGLPSAVSVGYRASRKASSYEVSKDNSSFSTEDFSFDKVQFTFNDLPHIYLRHRTVPNVNFIEFIFKNEDDSNMVLSHLSVNYSISQITRGVK